MEKPFENTCHRCGQETYVSIMSMFNTDILCPNCKSEEEDRKDYEVALIAEAQAVAQGDYNFPGIGL